MHTPCKVAFAKTTDFLNRLDRTIKDPALKAELHATQKLIEQAGWHIVDSDIDATVRRAAQ